MPTEMRTIGTTSVPICAPSSDPYEYIDILIQNLSANNVYVGSEVDFNQAVVASIKLVPTIGVYANDHRAEPVWLIADGAGSQVRIHYVRFKDSTRKRC